MTPPQAPAAAHPAVAPPEISALQLQLQDPLASSSRLWVRGRVVTGDLPVAGLPGWRDRWLGPKPVVAETPRVTVQTHVLGETLEQQVPLRPDGSFEATFAVGDSSAKRGWRVGRHQVRLGSQTVRACGVVLTPATDATTAVVVVLPSAFTRSKEGPRLFTHSGAAERLTPLV